MSDAKIKQLEHMVEVHKKRVRQNADLWCSAAEEALRGKPSRLRTLIETHRNPDNSGAKIIQSEK